MVDKLRTQRLRYLNAKHGPVQDEVCDEEWFRRRAALLAQTTLPKLVRCQSPEWCLRPVAGHGQT